MRRFIRFTGYVLAALVFIGVGLQIAVAIRGHRPFYGANAWGQPLGAYSGLVVLIAVIVLGGVRLVQIAVVGKRRARR